MKTFCRDWHQVIISISMMICSQSGTLIGDCMTSEKLCDYISYQIHLSFVIDWLVIFDPFPNSTTDLIFPYVSPGGSIREGERWPGGNVTSCHVPRVHCQCQVFTNSHVIIRLLEGFKVFNKGQVSRSMETLQTEN